MTQAILDTAVESSNQKGVPKPTELAEQKEDNRKAFLDNHDPFDIAGDFADAMCHYKNLADTMQLFARVFPTLKEKHVATLAYSLLETADWHTNTASGY